MNRDTTSTTKELWNSEQNQTVDATLDHRLLNLNGGWKDIAQDAEDTAEGAKVAVDKIKTEFAVITTNLPEDKKQLGSLMEKHLDEIIRQGGDTQAFMEMLDDPEYQQFAMNLLEIRDQVNKDGVAAFDAAAIANQATGFTNLDGSFTGINYVEDPLGIRMLQNLSDAKSYLDKLPPEQAAIAMMSISTIAGGPVKTLVQYGKDAALDFVAGDAQSEFNNWVANGIGGAAHGTSGKEYAFYSNPEILTKVEHEYDRMLDHIGQYGMDSLTPEQQQKFAYMDDYLSSPLAESIRTEAQSTASGAQLATTILLGAASGVGGKDGNDSAVGIKDQNYTNPNTSANLNDVETETKAGSKLTHINGALGEAHGYKRATEELGHVGIQSPEKVTAPGADFVTIDPKDGTIYVWDSKYRGPNATSYPSSIPPAKLAVWTSQLKETINSMPDGPIKDMALDSLKNGKIQGEIFKWPQ